MYSIKSPCRSIKNDYQFRRAYSKGKSVVSPCLVCYCTKRKKGGILVGITTGKKVGNAVLRNRARRLIRESARLLKSEMSGNWEIVFVARSRTPHLKMQSVMSDMRRLLTEAGVILKTAGK